jgi:hypothetical protein
MNATDRKTSRRRFFTQGGAALGAGVAATVGASGLTPDDPTKRLREMEEREAVRQLHLAFTSLIEQQAYDAAAELFDEHAHLNLNGASATGRRAIARQLSDRTAAAFHRAYRQCTSQQSDSVTVTDDRVRASAAFNIEVELCTPLQDDCTAATMARLQGNVADLRWESGRFEAKYVKTRGEWKITSLVYRAA